MIDGKRLVALLNDEGRARFDNGELFMAQTLSAVAGCVLLAIEPPAATALPIGVEIRPDGLWVKLSDGLRYKVLHGDEKVEDIDRVIAAMSAYAARLRIKGDQS